MAKTGDRVRHALWGPGRILQLLDGGRRWRVLYDAFPGLPQTVKADQMEARSQPDLPELDFEAPPADLRQSLEALRLGVVPAAGLEGLTIARDKELARIRELIERARGMILLAGGYGTGKTHLIEVAENRALRANMLVARATFDPVEVPPSHPLRLYRALARGIRYPDSSGMGLQPLLDRMSSGRSHHSPKGQRFHRYLSPAAWALEFGDDVLTEDLVAFVEGQLPRVNRELTADLKGFGWGGPNLLALPDYRTFGQIMSYLLGGIATWARDAGYRGLLVLADEAEYLDQLGAAAREMASNVLRYLAMGSLEATQLAFEPSAVYRGGQRIHRSLSPCFTDDQPLAVMAAFTPHPGISETLASLVSDQELIVPLEPIPLLELARLADHILALYRQAYPSLNPPDAHRQAVIGCIKGGFRRGLIETTRQSARLVVEFWDLYRCSPERALAAIQP